MSRPKKIIKSPYLLTVKVLGRYITAQGATFDEAVENIDIGNIKGTSVWKLEHDGLTREKIMRPFTTYRLFNTKGLVHDILLRNFKTLFGV